MKKIKQLTFVLFIFSVLAFSYPVTQVFAQSINWNDMRQPDIGEEDKRHLQRFFVDRRVDRHTPIYVEAFNSCTPGINFTLQSLRDSLTPARGTTVDDTIELFMRHLGSHRDNLKACLCRSDIDIRILRGGLGCDETALAFRDAARRGEERQKAMGGILRTIDEARRNTFRNMK